MPTTGVYRARSGRARAPAGSGQAGAVHGDADPLGGGTIGHQHARAYARPDQRL